MHPTRAHLVAPTRSASDEYDRKIGELVDVYRGPVPVGVCISTAHALGIYSMEVYTQDGQDWLDIVFHDHSTVVIALSEEV